MTAGFFLLIVAAAKLIDRWAGLGVFLAETALIAAVITLKRSRVTAQWPRPAGATSKG